MQDKTADESVANSITFQLLRLGQLANHRFVDHLAPLGLRPRHCAVLELLRTGSMAQLELANCLGVAPSVVVDMIDELQDLHAVARVRSAADRRRQFVELTPHGRSLVRRAANAARALDADLLQDMDSEQRAGLWADLCQVAAPQPPPSQALLTQREPLPQDAPHHEPRTQHKTLPQDYPLTQHETLPHHETPTPTPATLPS